MNEPRGKKGGGGSLVKNLTGAAMRLGLQVGSLVAPGAVDRWAFRTYFRPRAAMVPKSASEPRSDGIVAERLPLELGGERIAAWQFGQGPTVLVIHGWGGRAAQLSPFIGPLVAAGRRVVAFDLPAHGASSGETTQLVKITRVVEALFDQLSPTAIVAHSLGAHATVLALARRLGAGKPAIERAALLSPSVEVPYFTYGFASLVGLPRPRAEAFARAVTEELGGDLDALDLRLVAKQLDPARVPPLLVLQDPKDRLAPSEHGRAFASAWPGGRFEEVASVGHYRIMSDPGVVSRVTAFVTGG